MSRLDDELKVAFRRVEPSADFAERVLGRINNRKPSLWQKLKSFLEPPVARWVAVGVATSLLVAIFASQYQRLQSAKLEQETAPVAAQHDTQVKTKDDVPQPTPLPLPENQRRRLVKLQPNRSVSAAYRNLLARQRKERQFKIEAERAKEQVILALHIASTTLNEANKMVRGDD
jgi:hypothetical protein